MRGLLDNLYRISGWAAAFFLLLIALTIIGQILGRFFGFALDSTESGGFSLAATTFLGLAHTLKNGAHIRVNLLIRKFRGPVARAIELWCSGVAGVVLAYFSWQTILMTLDSWEFGELSPGLLAIPMWIPQSGMALGLIILTIAFFDEFWIALTGGTPGYANPIGTALGDTPEEGAALPIGE